MNSKAVNRTLSRRFVRRKLKYSKRQNLSTNNTLESVSQQRNENSARVLPRYFSTTKSKIVDEHKFSTYKSTPSDFYDYDFLFGPICSVVSYHPNRNFATFSFFSLPGLPRPQIVINFVRMVQYRPISLLVRDPMGSLSQNF